MSKMSEAYLYQPGQSELRWLGHNLCRKSGPRRRHHPGLWL